MQCHRLSHSVGTKSLFQDLDLAINAGERVGLVGHNGSGKSTLLAILDQRLQADSGDISRNRDLQVESVEQFIGEDLTSLCLLDALVDKLPAGEKTTGVYRAEHLLDQLGFTDAEHDYLVGDLSGGQKNRLMFARALITEPTLILFDEPTNHLDLRTLLIFEKMLASLSAAFIIVSHDREFLDAVTSKTVFLRDERLYHFELPYSQARTALEEHDEAAAATRQQEEKTIKRLEASAKRIAAWSRAHESEKLARKAKSMEKRIDRLKDEQTFVTRGSGLKLTLDVSSAQANRMLAIENRDVQAPDNSHLFHIDDFMIRPGERVALLGHNGAGKTTLISLIMTHYENNRDSDIVKFNPQSQVGYYDQELEQLTPDSSLMACIRDNCGGADNALKSELIRAGFPYRELDKKVEVCSGGEKARLMFLIMKLNQPNFLILDEPTNHIDIQGKEELEAQILSSNATVLLTSHDRRFVDHIADRFVLIHNGRLQELNDPDEFYRMNPVQRETGERDSSPRQRSLSGDDILGRIVELEELLAADQARKQKFQKPKLQDAWQKELDELNERLGD